MLKNWMTTGIGSLFAIAYLILRAVTNQGIDASDLAIAGGLSGLGAAAKDNNKTGR